MIGFAYRDLLDPERNDRQVISPRAAQREQKVERVVVLGRDVSRCGDPYDFLALSCRHRDTEWRSGPKHRIQRLPQIYRSQVRVDIYYTLFAPERLSPSARERVTMRQIGQYHATVATVLSFSTAALSTRAVGTEATSWAVWTSARRLILAVTGSSADTRRAPVRSGAASTLLLACSSLIRPASSAMVGAPSCGSALDSPALNWSRQTGELVPVAGVR